MAHQILSSRDRTGSRRMRRAHLVATATLAASTLLLAACGSAIQDSAGGGSDDVLTIGLIAPLTGPVVPEGTALERGFELGVKRINEQGGVLGKPVKFVQVDDEANVAKSTQLAQRLINQDHVDFLFGTIPGDTTAAVAQVSAEAKVPFASAILGDAPFCGHYFFSFGEPDQTMLDGIVPEMLQKHGDKVALVGNDYVFPRAYNAKARAMIERAGGKVVMEEYSPLGTSDWQPVVRKIGAAAPDWVLSSVVGGDAVAFVTQLDQARALAHMGFTGVSLNQDFYPSLKSRTEGMVLSGRYSDQLDNQANADFVENYRDSYDFTDPIPSVAANAYEGVQAIARAVDKAGTTKPDAVVKALAATSVDHGVFGSGTFTKDHYFVTDMYLFQIQSGGAYVPVKDLGALQTLPPNPACS